MSVVMVMTIPLGITTMTMVMAVGWAERMLMMGGDHDDEGGGDGGGGDGCDDDAGDDDDWWLDLMPFEEVLKSGSPEVLHCRKGHTLKLSLWICVMLNLWCWKFRCWVAQNNLSDVVHRNRTNGLTWQESVGGCLPGRCHSGCPGCGCSRL